MVKTKLRPVLLTFWFWYCTVATEDVPFWRSWVRHITFCTIFANSHETNYFKIKSEKKSEM